MTKCTENVVLIGMPGAGKSTLGVVMAKIMGYDFMDADLVIQHAKGKKLHELIDELGAEGFLAVENDILSQIETDEPTIIATGGSAIYSDEAMRHLAQIGTIVYLHISFDELKVRLGDLHERGVVMKGGAGMGLQGLYDERFPLYEKYGQVVVDVNGLSITDAARKVAVALSGE